MTLLCLCFISTEIKATVFTDNLQKYCVPTNENGCMADVKATYNEKTGYCECNAVNKHYNTGLRGCEECVYGSFASVNWKTCEPINCPSGYTAVLVENGKCPSGYGLTQVVNGSCGNGYSLKQYNLSTKTFK